MKKVTATVTFWVEDVKPEGWDDEEIREDLETDYNEDLMKYFWFDGFGDESVKMVLVDCLEHEHHGCAPYESVEVSNIKVEEFSK